MSDRSLDWYNQAKEDFLEYFTPNQAEEALGFAERILEYSGENFAKG